MHVLNWMKERNFKFSVYRICRGAARGGHIDIINWAKEHGAHWEVDIFHEAARGGHIEVLMMFQEQGESIFYEHVLCGM